jgi:hypothetical protein
MQNSEVEDHGMDLNTMLKDPPKVHEYEDYFVFHLLPRPVLDFVDAHVNEHSKTLETGCGLSTIVFAMRGGSHICITPSQGEMNRLRDYCERSGISLQGVDFQIGMSTDVFPKLTPVELDLALIDGGHGFPTVFMDWYYIASWLKTGGILIIDDLQIWTGHVLKEFLLAEAEWELVELIENKTAIFVKKKSCSPWNDFYRQPYVQQQSALLNFRESKFRKGLRLLRQGRILTLAKKVAGQVTG